MTVRKLYAPTGVLWAIILAPSIFCGVVSSCGKEQSASDSRQTHLYNQNWWLKRGSENREQTFTTWGNPHAEIIQTPDTNTYPKADTIYYQTSSDSIRLIYYYNKL